ncbi:hypothetical protein [Mycoplasma sp. Mirounga ES2805-ORL]|uniref:hypothetical protein n=1 Tax=Mycoplasma sp. Mirounga ES2805-ORL TaxID=754514 RepID=UPI00197C79DD|nr:hypothetical protein [Mycoplasma sp. Mirounga ES2805-ORL]QSF13767.1 hypothetical protein JXZ90_00490 [Mycoplasma sp. Mirounga ES2805-ORL]
MKTKEYLKFSKKDKESHGITIPVSSKKQFWTRFFTNKLNLIAVIILFVVLLVLIISSIFSYSYNEPINNSLALNKELPSSLHPWKTMDLSKNPESNLFVTLAKDYPDLVKVDVDTNFDIYHVSYNAYGLMNKINNTHFAYNHILGTNSNGIDIYSRIVNSNMQLFLVAILSLSMSMFISTAIGILLALYVKKSINDFIYNLIQAVGMIPYLFITVILFIFVGTSFGKSLLIFSLASGIFLFISSFQRSTKILQEEYIMAEIANGFSKWDLFWRTMFLKVLNYQLIQIVDQFILIYLSYAALGLLSIDLESNFNIGVIIKESTELFFINPAYLIVNTSIIFTLILTLKIIVFGLSKSYEMEV